MTTTQELKFLIENNNRFLLINHIRMDPDAFGSLAGFYYILKKLGKQVRAVNDEQTPSEFNFLIQESIINPQENIAEFDPQVVISFDAASIEQLGNSYKNNKTLFDTRPFIVIDHHITNPGFGSINIIDTKASSSCELIYDIISDLGYADLIDKEIATLLLAGIHTDTNTFYNKNTTSHTLKVAGVLLDIGARNKKIIFEFFRKKTLEKVHLWAKLMKEIKQEAGITWVCATRDIYKNTQSKDQGFKGFINEMLANIEGTRIAFFLYEEENGDIKASLRSNDDILDVSKICADFGGGGHRLAAGFSYQGEIGNLEKKLLEIIKTSTL